RARPGPAHEPRQRRPHRGRHPRGARFGMVVCCRVRSSAVTESSSLEATRAAYDAVASLYAERFRDSVAGRPLDGAAVGAFAELVRGAGGGPVADLGCGPGGVTARLASLGLPAF